MTGAPGIKEYVGRLIKFRTTSDALAVSDTSFIHVDLVGIALILAGVGLTRNRAGQAPTGADRVTAVVSRLSRRGTAE